MVTFFLRGVLIGLLLEFSWYLPLVGNSFCYSKHNEKQTKEGSYSNNEPDLRGGFMFVWYGSFYPDNYLTIKRPH